MPIEELLAMYNCVTPPTRTFVPNGSGSKRRSKTSRNAGLDKTLMPPPETPKTIAETTTSNERVKDDAQSEDAAIAETDHKLNTNSESAETAAATSAADTSTTTTTNSIVTTLDRADNHTDKEDDGISDETAKSKIDDNNGDHATPEGNDTKPASAKSSGINEELTESNTSDKENNVKDDNKPHITEDATGSDHGNGASTKATIDAVESTRNDGIYSRFLVKFHQTQIPILIFAGDEKESKPVVSDALKSEDGIKKSNEAVDETLDEGRSENTSYLK